MSIILLHIHTIAGTIYKHYEEFLNFFNNRSTNASAESGSSQKVVEFSF